MGIKAGKAVLDCLFKALCSLQGSQVLVMPLSKTRNRERMRRTRLHKKVKRLNVQPKPLDAEIYIANDEALDSLRELNTIAIGIPDNSPNIAYIDADGSPVYEEA